MTHQRKIYTTSIKGKGWFNKRWHIKQIKYWKNHSPIKSSTKEDQRKENRRTSTMKKKAT
jgi:DNA-binding PadR family transcriptional regulator